MNVELGLKENGTNVSVINGHICEKPMCWAPYCMLCIFFFFWLASSMHFCQGGLFAHYTDEETEAPSSGRAFYSYTSNNRQNQDFNSGLLTFLFTELPYTNLRDGESK